MSAARGAPSFGRAARHARPQWLFAFVAVAAFGGIAIALVTQHVFGMQPCPWCVLLRLIFSVFGLVALLGVSWHGPLGTRVVGTIALVLAAIGVGVALWQHFVAANSASCNLTFADKVVTATKLDVLLPEVFEARASCAEAAVSLLGVKYDLWAATLFAICAIAVVRALRNAG